MKLPWLFQKKQSESPIKQKFDISNIDPKEISVFTYKDINGDFDYKRYKEVQIATNIRKLKLSSINSKDIEHISNWLRVNVDPLKNGLCHGSRNGKEQLIFRDMIDADVWGTDISPTATQFPYTIQHDFHEIKQEWLNYFDFIFSNAYDHSYNLEHCICQWMRCIREGGVCILEHTDEHISAKESDPIGITRNAFCHLLNHWGNDSFSVESILQFEDDGKNTDASFVYTNKVYIVVRKQK